MTSDAAAGEFLDVASYTNVQRWADAFWARTAVKRGSRVNRAWGAEESQVLERHSAADVDAAFQSGSED